MKKVLCLILLVFSFSSLQAQEGSIEPPQSLVLFGATGDLAKRKLFPALTKLEKKGELSENFIVIGVGRRAADEAAFLEEAGTFANSEEGWEKFKKRIHYVRGSYEDGETFEKIQTILKGNALFYLSTPPTSFSEIVKNLYEHHLLDQARVVVEKPFGRDLTSAMALQKELTQYLNEDQIYRMDHYLGMELLQKIVPFRKENAPIEAILNHRYVDHISIQLSEEIGVGDRGIFWEETGTLRDVIQNHVMQLVSHIAMDLPLDENLHKEKVRVLESFRSFPKHKIDAFVKRGQYEGYRKESGVDSSSRETYVSATLLIDNKRWKGVPFYLESGKRLSKKMTQIEIVFKKGVPLHRILFQFHPKEQITIWGEPDFKENAVYVHKREREPYERLILEALRGDHSHFATYDELIASWRLWTPVLAHWETTQPDDFPNYTPGSNGPES